MPPKQKITKAELVEAGLSVVRECGPAALNARSLAARLACSTQPIFSNFETMAELEAAVREAAYAYYLSCLEREAREGRYPPYKAFGMAYIRFAREERELFKLLFMCDRTGVPQAEAPDFSASIEMIREANHLPYEVAERMHLEMWSCVHGIGVMLATSFLDLGEEVISRMLSDVYRGLQGAHREEAGV